MLNLKHTFLKSIFILLLFTSSCTVSPSPSPVKFQATAVASRKALMRGQIKEALAYHEAQALEAEKKAAASTEPKPYLETARAAYKEASRIARFTGETQKMIAYSEKSMAIARQIGQPAGELNSIDQMIMSYSHIGNNDKVRELIAQGFGILSSLPPQSMTRIDYEGVFYRHLGTYNLRQRDYKASIEAYSQSVYLREKYLSLSRGKSKSSVRGIQEALLLSMTGPGLANAYFMANRLEEALATYQRALNLINEWGLKYVYEDSLYSGMGAIYARQNKVAAALESYNKAIAVAESQQRSEPMISLRLRTGDLLSRSGSPSEAIPYFEKAIDQIESTRSLLQSRENRQTFFEGSLVAYAMMIDACVQTGKGEEAFNYSERARSRDFLDTLGNKVQLSRARGGLPEQEKTLQERIAAIKASLSVVEEQEVDRSDLLRQLSEAENAYDTYVAQVRKQDKEQASLMSVEPLNLKQVQELLDPGTTLIEYFVTGSNTHVWLVETGTLYHLTVNLTRAQINNQVKQLHNAISALGQKEKFDQISASLYNQLIKPLVPYITGKEIIIVPHDALHYLPFHALLSSKGHYLVEDYPVYYLSSASLIPFTKEKRNQRGELSAVLAHSGKVLAFGNPDLGDPSMDLKFAELEAREVGDICPKSTVLLRREATEEKAKHLSPEYEVVHFATHAELREEDPLTTAMLLAHDAQDDGKLQVREIFGMDLKANMVVLSACETGLGKLSRGDELVGLTRAFIYAGTPSVVASLWKVDDSSTTVLMGSFYKKLQTMSKVEALRQAQLELIRGEAGSDSLKVQRNGSTMKRENLEEGKFSHPYFWAPFILVGEAR